MQLPVLYEYLTADKLIESASVSVKENIIAFAVVDFELVVCPFSVPRTCNNVHVVIDAVLYVLCFKSAKPAVIGNGGVILADFFLRQGITSYVLPLTVILFPFCTGFPKSQQRRMILSS